MVLQLFPFTFFPFVHDFAFIILLYLIPPDSSPHLASPSLGYLLQQPLFLFILRRLKPSSVRLLTACLPHQQARSVVWFLGTL